MGCNGRESAHRDSSYTICGDISVTYKQCDVFAFNCHDSGPTKYGDILLLPGDSDPTATPSDGGVKYLNGPLGPDNYQWGLHEAYVEDDPIGDNLAIEAKIVAGLWNTAPAFRNVLESKLQQIKIPDCVTGNPTSITDEIIEIIGGRVSGSHAQCQAQWGDN